MSLFDVNRCKKEFLLELQKQTKPYAYFVAENETSKGGVLTNSSPLVSVVEFGRAEQDLKCAVSTALQKKSDYIVFIDVRGRLEENAVIKLFSYNEDGQSDILYCDEDYESGALLYRHTPWLKPDWSPDTLLSCNYFGGLFAIRHQLVLQVSMLSIDDAADESVQMYDFMLKCTEQADRITHVAEILFHNKWELYDDSMESAVDSDIYRKYVEDSQCEKYEKIKQSAFERRGFRKNWWTDCETELPLVSLIIPSKDHAGILIRCLNSILGKTSFCRGNHEEIINGRLEIIIIDNGSCEAEKEKITSYIHMKENNGWKITYIYDSFPFNYSKMCHIGANMATGKYLLFMNDDVEAGSENFIEKMLYYAAVSHVGAVGIKLFYPDSDIIQHAGVTDLNCGPSHKLATHPDREVYYFGRNRFNMDVLAVTGACMMMSKEKYFQVGGFSDRMEVGYNDIDLCVSLYEQGYFNIVLNDCTLYHHESLSRGEDHCDDKKYLRLSAERKLFYEKHAWLFDGCDPFYNRHLLQDTLDYRIDVEADYEKRDYRNNVLLIKLSALPKKTCGFLDKQKQPNFNIERVFRERALYPPTEDAIVFEGWSLMNKSDNRLFERFLCLLPDDDSLEEVMQISVSPKYRDDVKEVFLKAKYAELAGFVCKIPVSYLHENKVYRIGMLFESKLWNRKYLMLGDYYATGRGYFTKEVCLL